MTNDFAVSDSQQTRKSPMLPLIGAVGGGYAGYKISNRRGADKDWNDLIKEVKDTTDFSKKENPDLWQGVKDKLAEVDRLEAELKKASEAKLSPNTDVERRLADVEKEVEEALAKLRESSNRTSTGTSNFPKYAEIKPTLDKTSYPKGYGEINRAHCSKSASAQDIFTKYLSELETAENNLTSRLKGENARLTALRNSLNGVKDSTPGTRDGLFTEFYNKLGTNSPDEIAEYFRNSKKGDGYKEISKYFDKNFGELTNDNIESVFKEWLKKDKNFEKFELLDTEPSNSRRYEKIKVMGNDGFLETKWVSKSEYETALEDFGNELKKTRTESIEKMLEPAQKYVEGQKRLDKLFEYIASKESGIEAEMFVDAGIIPNKDNRPAADQVEEFIKKAKNATSFTDAKGNVFEGYTAAEKRLEIANKIQGMSKDAKMADALDVLRLEGKAGITPEIIDEMKNLYGDDVTLTEAIKKAKAKNTVYDKYISEEKSIRDSLTKIIDENPMVKEQMDKIAEIQNNSTEGKALKSIRRKLADTFPGIFGKYNVDGVVTETTAEITADRLPPELKEKLKKVKEEHAEALKKDGVVDETAKKNAEEALAKGKKELEDAGKKLGEKIGKTGGTKGKIIGTIIGVAAGAGLLWMIAPKKSKKA